MWSPTHVQVLVRRAKGLNVKGKNGTNDAFVTIGLGKEKFQTSVKERSENPEWLEQCELGIPQYGNRSELVLRVLHRNYLGGDEFLGQTSLPLQDFDVYEKPKAKWYPLTCKPGQNKPGYRGELEVKIGFTVRANDTASTAGSVSDLSKKARGSISSLNKVAGNIGGSLLSLGGKEKKNLARLASAVSGKVEKVGHKAKKTMSSSLKINKDKDKNLETLPEWGPGGGLGGFGQHEGRNLDPGVESDEDEDNLVNDDLMIRHPRHNDLMNSGRRDRDGFQFDTLSHGSSHSSVQLQLGGMGTVSAVHTPLQGSVEEFDILGGVEENTGVRHDHPPHDTMSLTSGVSSVSVSTSSTQQHTWLPQTPETVQSGWQDSKPENYKEKEIFDTASVSSLPTYNQAMETAVKENKKREQKSFKKKIIPVQSDSSESASSSPSPAGSPQPQSQTMSLSSRYRMTHQPHVSQDIEHVSGLLEVPSQQQPALGQKLKNSYSFRDRKEPQNLSNRSQQQQQQRRKNSIESQHSFRSTSSTCQGQGPPYGTRVVLGRETSPSPDTRVARDLETSLRLPAEIVDKFSGQTREDLIEMVVRLQSTVEGQGKKVADLEDYIDSLLIRVMDTAPVLLEKNIIFAKSGKSD